MGQDPSSAFRSLPQVDKIAKLLSGPDALRVAAARRAVDEARNQIRAGQAAPNEDEIVAAARALLEERDRALLHPVINATGVIVHTNLGRVPLGRRQLDAVAAVAGSYSNLEFDLTAGTRGDRYSHAQALVNALAGSERALVVNNNAAALLLVLSCLCKGREVIISRGELIEIGGEFRIPEVMEAAGVRLVEIGTTNRTHLADYERAITPETAAILKVHPSNYRVIGFTRSVAPRDVAKLARGRGVCFIHDLGSGLLLGPEHEAFTSEPTVDAALREGADVVTFSGDKLLGGPQAGVIAGRGELIDKMARHPLLRALRVDKMTLAALEATLLAYLEGDPGSLPLWQMALASLEGLEDRARALAATLSELEAKIEAVGLAAVTGGGSLPGEEISSWGLQVTHPERSAAEIERSLRFGRHPVVARIEDDRVLLDLRTVDPAQDKTLGHALHNALS